MKILSKFLNLIKSNKHSIFLAFCIGLISFISYNLGQIDALQQTPIKIVETGGLKAGGGNLKADIYSATKTETIDNKAQTKVLDTRGVASRNSEKYHYTWCAGAKKIKEENKVWFSSAQEAESRGYALAGNCLP